MDSRDQQRYDQGEDRCELCGKWITTRDRVVVEDPHDEERYPAHRRCAQAAHDAYLRSLSGPRGETPE
jgi:hypothetical protein